MNYIVSATVQRAANSSRQVPTFILNGNIQGIISRYQAEAIAKSIIDPYDDFFKVHISVVEMF